MHNVCEYVEVECNSCRVCTANGPAGLFRVLCRSEVGAKSFSVIMNAPEFIFQVVSDKDYPLSQTLIKLTLPVSYWSIWGPGSPLGGFWNLSVFKHCFINRRVV